MGIIQEIRNRFSGEIVFSAEIECAPDAPPSLKLGLAVKAALKEGANLSRANLSRANLSRANLSRANLSRANLSEANLSEEQLRPFKADMWMTLTMARHEVSGLIKALQEGRVDGSCYTGECACLVGTIANVRDVNYEALNIGPDADHPAEKWFMMINKGDKPGDASGGGFASQKALEWALEWCVLNGIEVPA